MDYLSSRASILDNKAVSAKSSPPTIKSYHSTYRARQIQPRAAAKLSALDLSTQMTILERLQIALHVIPGNHGKHWVTCVGRIVGHHLPLACDFNERPAKRIRSVYHSAQSDSTTPDCE